MSFNGEQNDRRRMVDTCFGRSSLDQTHKLQPLDVSFFKAFKAAYNNACREWLLSNIGSRITMENVDELVSKAFERSGNISNITNGFRKCGVWPFSRAPLDDPVFDEAPLASTAEHQICGQRHESRANCSSPTSTDDNDEPAHSDTTFRVLSPVPAIEKAKRGKSETSIGLTSSPYKAKIVAAKPPKESGMASRKRSGKSNERAVGGSVQSQDIALKGKRSAKRLTSNKCVWECLVCKELCSNTAPRSLCIQCMMCHEWAHEECAGPHGLYFKCSECKN